MVTLIILLIIYPFTLFLLSQFSLLLLLLWLFIQLLLLTLLLLIVALLLLFFLIHSSFLLIWLESFSLIFWFILSLFSLFTFGNGISIEALCDVSFLIINILSFESILLNFLFCPIDVFLWPKISLFPLKLLKSVLFL